VKFSLRSVGLTFLVSVCLFLLEARPAFAQAPLPSSSALEMIATNGGGEEKHFVSQNGFVGQLAINPNQVVPVTLQFPSDMAGVPVAVMSMDGGEITGDQVSVASDGTLHFTFHANASPGLYRVILQLPTEKQRLEFYVIDPNRPRNPRLRP
jgi:hypothetical protein